MKEPPFNPVVDETNAQIYYIYIYIYIYISIYIYIYISKEKRFFPCYDFMRS